MRRVCKPLSCAFVVNKRRFFSKTSARKFLRGKCMARKFQFLCEGLPLMAVEVPFAIFVARCLHAAVRYSAFVWQNSLGFAVLAVFLVYCADTQASVVLANPENPHNFALCNYLFKVFWFKCCRCSVKLLQNAKNVVKCKRRILCINFLHI